MNTKLDTFVLMEYKLALTHKNYDRRAALNSIYILISVDMHPFDIPFVDGCMFFSGIAYTDETADSIQTWQDYI